MKYSGTRQKIRHGNSQCGRFVLYSSKSVRVLTYPRKRYIIKQEEMNRWTLQRYYTEPERRGRGIAGELPVFITDDMESAESGRCIFWQVVTASAGGTAGGFCANWRGTARRVRRGCTYFWAVRTLKARRNRSDSARLRRSRAEFWNRVPIIEALMVFDFHTRVEML